MSRIRFDKTTEPATPPLGRSQVYVDTVDNHLKRKKDDGSVKDYDNPITDEDIQDAIGAIVTDTATIDLTYNDALNELKADVKPSSIGTNEVSVISPLKITDAQNGRYQSSLITNNSVYTTAVTIDCSVDGTWMVEAKITNRRIGGLAGSPGDGGAFKRSFRIKSIGSSVTIHNFSSDYTSRDHGSMKVEAIVSGTDVIIQVAGVTDNNLKWNCELFTSINT